MSCICVCDLFTCVLCAIELSPSLLSLSYRCSDDSSYGCLFVIIHTLNNR